MRSWRSPIVTIFSLSRTRRKECSRNTRTAGSERSVTSGCYSFHETKNFSCGEGGALVINDPGLEKRAEILRDKGTNRSQFLRGQVDKYTWVDIGSSYVLSDMLAAYLLGQLENMELITSRRRAIYQRYAEAFAALAADRRIGVPVHAAALHDQSPHVLYSGGRP